ncbi:hypothetical protein D3C73_688480 [compost metagenome]
MKRKPYVYAYLLLGVWFGLVIAYLPDSEWYRMIAVKPWAFVVVNVITLFPVLVILFIADRLQPIAQPVE